MNTRVFGVLQGFTGAVDIFFAGAGQAANLGLLDQLCDLADALKIAIGGNWKTGLDNVDAHCVQNLGDTQFFPSVMEAPGDCSPSRKVVSKIKTRSALDPCCFA